MYLIHVLDLFYFPSALANILQVTQHGGDVTNKQERVGSESTSESSGKGQKIDGSGHVNVESKQSSGSVEGKKVANSGAYECIGVRPVCHC